MTQASFHEDLRRQNEAKASSERAFGLVFAAAFLVIALLPLVGEPSGPPRIWAFAVAALFLTLALVWTAPLRPLNYLWFRFGLILHRVVSPLVMGLLFFVVMTPIGMALRLAGKDPLRLRFDRAVRSYWIERQSPGPPPEGMKNQF
jgi:hypothetical protein